MNCPAQKAGHFFLKAEFRFAKDEGKEAGPERPEVRS